MSKGTNYQGPTNQQTEYHTWSVLLTWMRCPLQNAPPPDISTAFLRCVDNHHQGEPSTIKCLMCHRSINQTRETRFGAELLFTPSSKLHFRIPILWGAYPPIFILKRDLLHMDQERSKEELGIAGIKKKGWLVGSSCLQMLWMSVSPRQKALLQIPPVLLITHTTNNRRLGFTWGLFFF